jgi:hypothetical protein
VNAENTESAMTRFEFVGPVEEQPGCLDAPPVDEEQDAVDFFDIGADQSFSDPVDSFLDDGELPATAASSAGGTASDLLAGIHLGRCTAIQ